MSTLYVTVGNIGSGKSTWARMRAAANTVTLIVSPDEIRAMLRGTYVYDPMLEELVVDICRRAIHDALLAHYDVIIDCCNMTRQRRRLWISAARELDASVVICQFPIGDSEWHIARRMSDAKDSRSREVWHKIWELNNDVYEQTIDDDCDARMSIDQFGKELND